MSISQHIPPSIKCATRCIGFALWSNTTDDWSGLHTVLRARLTPDQRAALAFMALRSLDHDTACQTADAVLGVPVANGGAFQPIAPMFNHMDEAAFWADMATPEELDAYCLASFNRMASQRQSAFLEFVQGRAAA